MASQEPAAATAVASSIMREASVFTERVHKLLAVLEAREFALQTITELESSGILEASLWKDFPDGVHCLDPHKDVTCFRPECHVSQHDPASVDSDVEVLRDLKASVLVLIVLLNEKFRQRLDVWESLNLNDVTCNEASASKFRSLFYGSWMVFLQPEKFALTTRDLSTFLQWFIYVFQSLEHTPVRRLTMAVCGIAAWEGLGADLKTQLLDARPELKPLWRLVNKRYRRLGQRYGPGVTFSAPTTSLEDRFQLLDRDTMQAALMQFMQKVEHELPAKLDPKNLCEVSTEDWTAVDVFSGATGLQTAPKSTETDALGLRNENPTDLSANDFLYCERFLEFLIDLLSQLPTRRFFRPLFITNQILPRLKLSPLFSHNEGALLRQLATLLTEYESFEVDDATGDALETRDIEARHYERVKQLQLVCFKHFKDVPFLQEVALGPVSALQSVTVLREMFSRLSLTQLLEMAKMLRLVEVMSFSETALQPLMEEARHLANRESNTSEELLEAIESVRDTGAYRKSHTLLVEVLANHLRRRPNQLDAINRLPLFPTETLIWDPNIVPTESYKGDFSLALPKLNIQFLTIRDYLIRNFHLFRLESAYGVREDLEDAVWRMRPTLGYDTSLGPIITTKLDTQFAGSSKMAAPIEQFAVVHIKEPLVGQDTPAEVRAEFTINLKRIPKEYHEGWNTLRQYDVLMLLAIHAPLKRFEGRPSDLASLAEFPEKFGVLGVRGCEIVEVLDEEGKTISESLSTDRALYTPFGDLRTYRVRLDPLQYVKDLNDIASNTEAPDIYGALNLVVRRRPAENNFKSILETIRDLMNDREHAVVPPWLHELFLGYGDPHEAQYFRMPTELPLVDFFDTFLDDDHVRASFPNVKKLTFANSAAREGHFCCITFPVRQDEQPQQQHATETTTLHPPEDEATVSYYSPGLRGPYPECRTAHNRIRFTAYQVEAIRSGVNPGLTLVVGPPGTGKTDTAVQIALLLHKNFPDQRILLLAHSNQALNELFEKIAALDIDERYLLRLGMGEKDLRVAADDAPRAVGKKDFSKWGRVNYMLQRRIDLLKRVDALGASLRVPGDIGASCETATQFYRQHIVPRIKRFRNQLAAISEKGRGLRVFLRDMRIADGTAGLRIGPSGLPFQKRKKDKPKQKSDNQRPGAQADDHDMGEEDQDTLPSESADDEDESAYVFIEDLDDQACAAVQDGKRSATEVLFPFAVFFGDTPTPLFPCDALDTHPSIAEGCFQYLTEMFKEIEECRAFELLRTLHDRSTYLLTRHAKIIAMTCTHAGLTRKQMIDMRLRYDTLIMEEAGQVLEIETFIPMVLQRSEHGGLSRLKRVVLLGDHYQLPPVVKNRGFQQHGHLDQSMFTRLIRLQVPFIQLDSQGRSRPSIRELFGWRYTRPALRDLPFVAEKPDFLTANAGFAYDYQFVDIQDYEGRGEMSPLPHSYQNLGEAEFAVAMFMYMRLLGYPAHQIAMLTTYNGQKALIKHVIQKRCGWNPTIGWPGVVSTVDKFQGQQAEYVILSLVRTRSVGYLRDVRRMIVAVSRARLGLYILGRFSLFSQCMEIRPIIDLLAKRPLQLALAESEESYPTTRRLEDPVALSLIPDIYGMWAAVQEQGRRALAATVRPPSEEPPPPPSASAMED